MDANSDTGESLVLVRSLMNPNAMNTNASAALHTNAMKTNSLDEKIFGNSTSEDKIFENTRLDFKNDILSEKCEETFFTEKCNISNFLEKKPEDLLNKKNDNPHNFQISESNFPESFF